MVGMVWYGSEENGGQPMPVARKRVTLDLAVDLYDRYERLAKRKGLTVTAWIRAALEKEASG